MRRQVISKSKDIILSSMGLGTMGFGGFFARDLTNNKEHVKLLETAHDLGVNVLDTAEVYGEGTAEETIGKTSSSIRNSLFIMSKFSPVNSKKENMIRSLDNSLSRLKRDYIDVYQPHWPQPGFPLDEILRNLEDLKKSGKIRFSGVSNFSSNQLDKADLKNFPSLRFFQCEYNPVEHKKAEDLFPYISQADGVLVAFSPCREGQIFKSNK